MTTTTSQVKKEKRSEELVEFLSNNLEETWRQNLELYSDYMGYDNASFHKELYSHLQHKFGHNNPEKRFLILWPRGHGKTECASINYVSWLVGNNPNININLVTKTASLAEEILIALITRLESDKWYRTLFGDLKPSQPKKWTSKEIIVTRTKISKNPTVKATGLMGPITGGRSDLIICDDIIDEENVHTRLQLEKVDTWFNKVLFPTLFPWGAILVIGTRWSYADIYNTLLDKWPYSVKKAIIDEKTQKVLWPKYWSYEKLVDRRDEIGSIFFNCQYQNDPTGMEGDLLQSQWLQNWTEPPPQRIIKYAGVDPALGEGDLQAIATFGYDRHLSKGYLLDVWADKISFPMFVKEKLPQLHRMHNYAKIYLESNAFQRVLMFLPEIQGLPVSGTVTDTDKERRFIAMSSHFESGRVLVNPLINNSRSEFWNEWVQFPRGQYDDALDATEIVIRNVMGRPKGYFV